MDDDALHLLRNLATKYQVANDRRKAIIERMMRKVADERRVSQLALVVALGPLAQRIRPS